MNNEIEQMKNIIINANYKIYNTNKERYYMSKIIYQIIMILNSRTISYNLLNNSSLIRS